MNPSKIKTVMALLISVTLLLCMLILNSCANQNTDADAAGLKSPVNSASLDYNRVEKGKALFEKNCITCHKFDSRSTGPALQGVTKRRTPDWITEMILNPDEMVENDATAKAMLAEYNNVPMAKMGISEGEAECIFQYLRKMDEEN